MRVEHPLRVCQLYWDIKWLSVSKQPEERLTTSELEIVSVSPGFFLSVEHASSVWQAMKIYVRISKLPVERDANGGYAQYMKVAEGFPYHIPHYFNDSEAAPLLCADAIGYRSLRLSGHKDGQNLGLNGFGVSRRMVLKMVKHQYPNTKVFVFARSVKEREFSGKLGAVWSGDIDEYSPVN